MYYIMRKSYYVMHKLLRYANNVLRYAVIITLCGNYYVMWRHTESDNFLFLPILLDAQTEGISQSGLISQILARHVTTLRYCGHRINAGRVLF